MSLAKIRFNLEEVQGLREVGIVVSVVPELRDQVESFIRRLGGRVTARSRTTNLITVVIPTPQLQALAALPSVLEIHRDVVFRFFQEVVLLPAPFGPKALELQSVVTLDEASKFLRADPVHRNGITGRGVRCAVVDTGILPNPRVGRVVARRSFVEGEPVDRNGHGTGVASVVSSIAPEAELIDAHALDESGASTFSRILEALEFAVLDARADVVNMSFGSLIPFPPAEEVLSELRGRGVSLVAAAGNSGPSFLTVGFPSASSLVVAVGGVAVRSPMEDAVSEFSSRGPSINGKIKPDICGASGTLSEGLLTAWLDGEKVVRGTSFSSPQVAGAECLLRQAFPEMEPDFYDGKLFASARDIELSGKDVSSGFGVMDIESALREQPRSAEPALQELLIGFFSSLLPK